MNYTEQVKIEKEIAKLDKQRAKLYKEFAQWENKQDNAKDEDFYILCSQKMNEIQDKLNIISDKNEELSDKLHA
jgi:hypothetical protein